MQDSVFNMDANRIFKNIYLGKNSSKFSIGTLNFVGKEIYSSISLNNLLKGATQQKKDLMSFMDGKKDTFPEFAAGNTGRPKGSRNTATIAIESLLQGQAEALTQTAVKKALEGDSLALRLCMERIAPAPKDQSVSFSLPKMNNAMGASEAARSVLSAVSEG